MRQKYFYLLAILCICAISLQKHSIAREANKPILLMGTGYSGIERRAIIKDILEPNELTFEDGGEFTSAELWKSYSLVIVTHGFPALDEHEIGWIQDYVKEGGKVLLTGPVLASLRSLSAADRDWLGTEGYRVIKEGQFTIDEAGKQFVASADVAATIFEPRNDYAPTKLTTAQALILRGDAPVLFRNNYGKGEVWFAGIEYFRILNTEKLQNEKLRVGAPARQFLETLILQGDVQKKSERIADGLKALGKNAPIVWRRDFDFARGANFAEPPYPQKDEELKDIHLDLGQNEWETTPFYLSSPQADKGFSITISDLISANGTSRIPASSIRLRVQGVAAPQLTVGPYWLLDVSRQDAASKSTFTVPLEANDSATIWLTLNTIDVPVGEYQGKISFSNSAMPPLDFRITVWPIKLPGREYFEASATSLWTSLMPSIGGKTYNFPNPPGDMTLFEQHLTNLANHHISFNNDASWVNRYGRSISLKNVRLHGTNTFFEEAIKEKLIKDSALPKLDFSYFDPFVEEALLRGIPYFHFNFKNLPDNWLGYARDITGDNTLEADSPRHLAIKRWLLSEIVSYLHSKGIRKIVSFIADEIAPDKIPETVQRAQLLRELGIQVEFTATGRVGQNREHIAALNPVIDRWIWNAVILPQAREIVKTNSPIDRTDTQFTYVADWHRAPYVFNRTRGAFCAYHELDGVFIHGYLRWYPNGGAVWNDANGPIDTEGWEGARDGIEDARYWKRAQFLLKAAQQHPELATRATEIARKMSSWVSPNPDGLVELKDASYSIYEYQSPVSSYQRLQTLKRELLEALTWLEEKVPTAKTLTYADLTLVNRGQLQVQLIGNAEAIKALNKVLLSRNLPAITSQPTAQTKVIFGIPAQVKELLGKNVMEDLQPGTESYQVAVKDNTILIIGGDDAGVRKGAEVLGNVIESSETTIATDG